MQIYQLINLLKAEDIIITLNLILLYIYFEDILIKNSILK